MTNLICSPSSSNISTIACEGSPISTPLGANAGCVSMETVNSSVDSKSSSFVMLISTEAVFTPGRKVALYVPTIKSSRKAIIRYVKKF